MAVTYLVSNSGLLSVNRPACYRHCFHRQQLCGFNNSINGSCGLGEQPTDKLTVQDCWLGLQARGIECAFVKLTKLILRIVTSLLLFFDHIAVQCT